MLGMVFIVLILVAWSFLPKQELVRAEIIDADWQSIK